MVLVDILIWAALIAFVVKGFMKGLVREACSLVGLLAGGWTAFHYFTPLAEAMRPLIRLPQPVALGLSFILIFFTFGLLSYLAGHLITGLLNLLFLGWLNRAGGVVLGFLEGGLILAILLYLCSIAPLPSGLKKAVVSSASAKPFIATGKEIVAGWDASAHFRETARGGKP